MADQDPSFLSELSHQERIHFRNLVLIRPQIPSEGQLQLLEGLARTLSSKRLLTLIARTPHWLLHGPVLEALAENESTPETIRRDLEMAVSLFDLMREMDRAPVEERDERAEMVKTLYQQLPPDLKPIVKHHAKALARQVSATGRTQELPPLPSEEQDWERLTKPPEGPVAPMPQVRLPRPYRLQRAQSTHQPEDLPPLLLDEDSEIREAALHNPLLTEELLLETLEQCQIPDLFEEVYAEARWYFRDSIREVLFDAPISPVSLTRKIRVSRDLLALLEKGAKHPSALRRISALFTQLDESEYQYVTLWAKKKSPGLLRVIKLFYDRLQRRRASQASGMPAHPTEGRWASLEERVFMANQATQPEQMIQALKDPDPQVFLIALENAALTPRELLAAIPGFDQMRAERLAAHRAWEDNPVVQEALLHCVHLSETTALRILARLTHPRALLDLLRDPRIPHLSVKQRAQESLRALYTEMDLQQRILLLRANGGEIMRHLPAEILKDEPTLHQLISDRQVDPSILLRLARNKLTPRPILEKIAAHPVLMAHPAIMSELLINPKTPRESAIRIWSLLSESEQEQLLRSPHLPTTLRHLG